MCYSFKYFFIWEQFHTVYIGISGNLENNIIHLKHVYQTKEQDKSVRMRGQTHHKSQRFERYGCLNITSYDIFWPCFCNFYEKKNVTFWHQNFLHINELNKIDKTTTTKFSVLWIQTTWNLENVKCTNLKLLSENFGYVTWPPWSVENS